MVTKYDIFEIVSKHRLPLKPIEVVKKLNKSVQEYNNILRLLKELTDNKLLTKTKHSFQFQRNPKTELLTNLIQYCLNNDINYNLLLNLNFIRFVHKALLKPEFNSKTFQINNRTFTKYIQILNKYGLLLLLSEKPLRARIFSNILIEKLLLYFGFKSRIKRIPINYLSEIGGELKQFKRLKRKNEAGFQKIILEREVSFVHHSLALEGNPITLPETIKILREKIIPGNLNSEAVDEVRNYQKALLQMLKDSQHKIPLTIETILEYHHLALQHRPEIAGKMRTVNVYIKGNPNFKIVPVTEIELKLNKLLKQYQMFIRTRKSSLKKVINFASFFHNEFQHIHPFVDGNSRITRLITLHLLQSKDIPILDFPFGLMDEYLHYTKGAKVREDKKLSENIQQIILYNLKKINGQLKL